MVSLQGNRVLVVDDDPHTRDTLERAFSRAGAKVYTATGGNEALQEFYLYQPDLVILDVITPDLDGWDTANLPKLFGAVPIIFLSSLTDTQDVVHTLRLGAYDFVTKPFSVRVLLMKAQAALRSTALAPTNGRPVAYCDGNLAINLAELQVLVKGRPVDLTATEYRLLLQLARNLARILPSEQLLSDVWGTEYRDDKEILWVSISRLRQKLEEDPKNPIHIVTRPGLGYTMPPLQETS